MSSPCSHGALLPSTAILWLSLIWWHASPGHAREAVAQQGRQQVAFPGCHGTRKRESVSHRSAVCRVQLLPAPCIHQLGLCDTTVTFSGRAGALESIDTTLTTAKLQMQHRAFRERVCLLMRQSGSRSVFSAWCPELVLLSLSCSSASAPSSAANQQSPCRQSWRSRMR